MLKLMVMMVLALGFQIHARTLKPLGKNFVRINKERMDSQVLQKLDFTQDHRNSKMYVFGYMSDQALEELKSRVPSAVTVIDPALDSLGFDYESLEVADKYAHLDLAAGYHNYDQLSQSLKKIAQDYPKLIKLKSAGKSVNGRELWYTVMSNYAEGSLKIRPKVLYVANMHGNETAGRELMLRLIEYLAEGFSDNTRIQNILNHTQVFIMPSMNPDGFENRRRGNQRGYDLNRSFPDFTLSESDDPSQRPIETQAVMNLHEAHHFVLALNFHGGAVCFNMPWDTQHNRTVESRFEEDLLMKQLARLYADLNQTMHDAGFDNGVTYGYEWYHVDGSLQDWASYFRQSVHATIELSQDKWPPADELEGIWQDNKESLLSYIESATQGYFFRIQDAQGRPIKNVKMKHAAAQKYLTYSDGIVLRPALEGIYKIDIQAEGFTQLTFEREVSLIKDGLSVVSLEARP